MTARTGGGALMLVLLLQLAAASSNLGFMPSVNVRGAGGGLDRPLRTEGPVRKELREEDAAKASQQADRPGSQKRVRFCELPPSSVLDRTPSGIAAATAFSDDGGSNDVSCADLAGFAEDYKESSRNHKTLGLLGASAMVYEWASPSDGEALAIKVNHRGRDLDSLRELLVLQHLRACGLDRDPARITRLRKGTLLPVGEGEYGMVMSREEGINPTPGMWRKMSWPEKVSHLRSFAVTLGTLHERGCVHRDIKRGNLLADERGVVLIDFTSMTCRGAEGLDKLGSYQVSGKKGSRYSRAPEATDEALDGDALTAAADAFAMGLYALDVLLGEALELSFMGRGGGTLEGEKKQELAYLEHVTTLDWAELVGKLKAKCEEGVAGYVEAIGRVCEGLLKRDPAARMTCIKAAQELGGVR